MAYTDTTVAGYDVTMPVAGEFQRYWIAFPRVITGWWLFHAGVTKLMTNGLNFADGPAYLKGMTGTALGPIPVWMGATLAWLIKPGVPAFETLIGLAFLAGALTRLAAFDGGLAHDPVLGRQRRVRPRCVNAELMGLLLFATMMVLAAGRYYGLDAIIEKTEFVRKRPRVKYLLG